MTAEQSSSFWKEAKTNLREAANLRNLAFYGTAIVAFVVLSILLPYQTQVYLSIAAGITVALLLAVSMIFSRSIASLEAIFIGGVMFLLAALFKRGFLPPTVLQDFGHYSLAISLTLTGLYVVLQVLRSGRKSYTMSVKSLNDFFSVCSTTLSSEMCSCVHSISFLEALGVMALLPNQVRLGFVIMMTTLVYQIRLTYDSHKSRKPRATHNTNGSRQI